MGDAHYPRDRGVTRAGLQLQRLLGGSNWLTARRTRRDLYTQHTDTRKSFKIGLRLTALDPMHLAFDAQRCGPKSE
ncbi:protein of unknown function (plasmid) [Caballeronia sp. S22]